MRNTTTPQQLALADALRIAQQRHIVLIPSARSVKIWAPGVRVPASVRHTITTNKKEVLKLLDIGDIAVCPAPHLHRPAWSYFAGYYICDLCVRMDRAMRGLN